MSFKLIHDNRIKVPCTNTRVFGHGGNREQVHNEVYHWLDEMAGPLPGSNGTRWVERSYYEGVQQPMPFRPKKYSPTRPVARTYTGNKIAGKYFYFATKDLAMAFKLAWGGE